jgi:chromosome partitioning protein
MAMIVGVVSQKGGVGKSTLSRLIAGEFAAQNWQVKIADLDVSQATSFHWRSRRLQRSLEPDISVEQYGRVDQALKIAEQYDLLVLDGAPHATQATLQIAQASNLVVIPTGLAIDDLQPAVQLAHELMTHIPVNGWCLRCAVWEPAARRLKRPAIICGRQVILS